MKLRAGVILLVLTAAAGAEPLAYVTDQSADAVSIVDLAQGRTVETIGVGQKPAGVAVAPGGMRIYVSNPESRSISIIERRGQNHQAIAEIKVGQGPLGLALDPVGARLRWPV